MHKFGPPHPKPRPYPYVLEVLETQANKKLTSEYYHDVKQWLAQLELPLAPSAHMIDLQPEVQWYMRPYLLDFLLELHQLWRMQPATLFLCLNIFDRYCAKRIVYKRHYQLVGCTALWIAAKYEDKKLRVPALSDLAIMCRHTYEELMFLQMEFHILQTLEWLLSHPLLEECLQLSMMEAGVLDQVTPTKYNRALDPLALKVSAVAAVGRFFCELAMYDRFFMGVPLSVVAATANYMACSMLGVPVAANQLRRLADALDDNISSLSTIVSSPTSSSLAGQENTAPLVEGSFLSGFDARTLDQVRRTALALFLNTGSLSEVLSRKYEALGVVQVVHNYSSRHPVSVHAIFENAAAITAEAELPHQLVHAADVLLLLASDRKPGDNMHLGLYNTEARLQHLLPLTPPLATSLASVFSRPLNHTTPNLNFENGNFAQYSPNDCSSAWASPVPSSKVRV